MSIVKPKAFWPVTIGGTNNLIHYKVAGVDHIATVASGTYFSAATLAAACQAAMVAAGMAAMFVGVGANSSSGDFLGRITFGDLSNGAFILRWSITTNSIASVLGFPNVDTASAFSFDAPNQIPNSWYGLIPPADDSLPIRDRAADVVTVTMAGQTKFITENELVRRSIDLKWLAPELTYIAFEVIANTAIERLWQDGRSRFRWWPDGATEGTSFDYVLDYDTIKMFQPKRMYTRKGLYEVKLGILGYVA